jgi:hypothetical protein
MRTTLMKPTEWAQRELGEAELGDVRRTRRLVRLAASLAEESHGTLPQSLHNWAELKAAYRLLGEPDVSYDSILQPHWSGVRSACGHSGEVLLVEDTTSLDYSTHPAATGLGLIGDGGGVGLYLHTTLALRVHRWTDEHEPDVTVLGLFGQQHWIRREPTGAAKEKKARRLRRPRESQRWASIFAETGGPPPQSRWTFVADRESDIFEVFERCGAVGVDFIIRANQPRALADEGGSVFQAVSESPVMGQFSMHLRSRPARIKRPKRKGQKRRVVRPKQPGRTVVLEVRSCAVQLRSPWRPGTCGAPQPIHVVQVLEVNPPEDAEPIEWVLITTWPVDTLAACIRVVKTYACRWLIEEYHKALKSGTGIEHSQLTTAERIEALLGILAVVAVRLLNMKLLARVEGQTPLEPGELGPEVLALLEAKYGRPKEGWTYRTALIGIARLGGFLARKSDGLPGWMTLWRGWEKLRLMVQGYDLLNGGRCG